MERSGVRNVKKNNLPIGRNKRRGNRRNFGNKITYAQIGNKLYNDVMPIVKLAKKVFNTENKFLTTSAVATSISTTPALIGLNLMAQGNTASTRLGDTVKFDFIQWNIVCTINPAAAASQIRVLIVRDEQPNGATFGYTSLMDSVAVTSLTNFKQETRFYMFVDEIITLDSNGPQTLTFRGSKSIGFHTNYGLGNAGTIADISKNSLNLCFVSNEATNTPSVTYDVRVLFVDN